MDETETPGEEVVEEPEDTGEPARVAKDETETPGEEVVEEPEDTGESTGPSIPIRDLADFMAESTSSGLFPAVAFGLDPRGAPSTVGLLTSAITDFPFALQLVERVMERPVSPYRFTPLVSLAYIAERNAIMKLHTRDIPGFDSNRVDHRQALSRLFAYCTASRWASRAFLLIDMVAFSQAPTPQQLALRMGLGQAIDTCIRRMYKLQQKRLVVSRRFNRISTGDGFYLWNYDWSPEGHVAAFVLLVLLLSHTEAMFHKGLSPLRLRAAYGIGEAYTFPYQGPGIPPRERVDEGFMPDAIGPILNGLSRLLVAASPGQLLVAPFSERGREERPGERLNVETMLTRVRAEILPGELDPMDPVKSQDIALEARPNSLLRITDKHGVVHHCYNVWGRVPDRRDKEIRLQTIGLLPDDAREVAESRFKAG